MESIIKELWHGNIIPQEDSRTNQKRKNNPSATPDPRQMPGAWQAAPRKRPRFKRKEHLQMQVLFLAQAEGFDSRANCALGLPRSRTSTGSPLCTDSPSNPFNKKRNPNQTARVRFGLLFGGEEGIRTLVPLGKRFSRQRAQASRAVVDWRAKRPSPTSRLVAPRLRKTVTNRFSLPRPVMTASKRKSTCKYKCSFGAG